MSSFMTHNANRTQFLTNRLQLLSIKTIKGKFTTDEHTATMVPVFAFGPGADEFTGMYENTEIFHKIMRFFDFKQK